MSRFDANYVPKSAMTIYAHPDDAEFSVAGTIARWARAGCQVTLVLCTSGNVGTHDTKYTLESLAKTRRKEQKAAAKILGVKDIVFLGHDDCQLQPTLELRRELVREIRKRKPEVVFCGNPNGWLYGNEYINHPDHRAAAAAALEAVFPCAEMELLWPELGKPHKVHAVYVNIDDKPDLWIDIADTIDLKIQSLKAHASQMGDWDPSDMIRRWAAEDAKNGRKKMNASRNKDGKKNNKRGGKNPTSKMKYAESFRVMKLVNDDTKPVETES